MIILIYCILLKTFSSNKEKKKKDENYLEISEEKGNRKDNGC
jgi:hypothetical protein